MTDSSDHIESPDAETPEPKKTLREQIRYWLSVIPGTKRDYFLLTLAVLDCSVIIFSEPLLAFLPVSVSGSILAFDFIVVAIWAAFYLRRLRREEDRWVYVTTHWYELIGMVPVPLSSLRFFLLLRAVKLAIAYYKLGRADQDTSTLLTKDFTFRFRDVIVDSISDAVFARSLERVEEVMLSLDYEKLARDTMDRHKEDLRASVSESLTNKSMIGELRRVPLMGGFADRLTADVGLVVAEILERRVIGDIMQDISTSILAAMHERLRQLDLERIAGASMVAGSPTPIGDGVSAEEGADTNTAGGEEEAKASE